MQVHSHKFVSQIMLQLKATDRVDEKQEEMSEDGDDDEEMLMEENEDYEP